jgi:hypothetical protein
MSHWYGHDAKELGETVASAKATLRLCAHCNKPDARAVVELDRPLRGAELNIGAALTCGGNTCRSAFQRNVDELNRIANTDAADEYQVTRSQRAALAALVSGPSSRTTAPAPLANDDDGDDSMPVAEPLTAAVAAAAAVQPVEETLTGTVRRRTHQLFGGLSWDERVTPRALELSLTVLGYIDRGTADVSVLRNTLAVAGHAGRELYDMRVYTLTRIAVFVPPEVELLVDAATAALNTLQTWTVLSPGAIPYSALSAAMDRIEVRSVNNTRIVVRLVTSGLRRGGLQVDIGARGTFFDVDKVITLRNGQISLLKK